MNEANQFATSEIKRLTLLNKKLQAKIDSLMLEYCPNKMAQEQKENWAKHQVLSP